MDPSATHCSRMAVNAEAMLPGGPYDLWRDDEPSRRVKDLVSAFAENPKLPKVLRQKEILDTIDNGVKSGIFVAVRKRPDQSVSGTWWRTPIEEGARNDAALEVFLPEKANLSELDPSVLAPSALPDLWPGDSVSAKLAQPPDLSRHLNTPLTRVSRCEGPL